jgi:probable H4MPT-linked C1 transfer pathway protein
VSQVPTIGFDIGGANLKGAHSSGVAQLQPFALWKSPDQLVPALSELICSLPAANHFAVTMTGELCDCFDTRRQGVLTILEAMDNTEEGDRVLVWERSGRFVGLGEARAAPLEAAAANWLALATFAGRYAKTDAGLVIDIGSTTTDIVPLWQGRPFPIGLTDLERLQSRELVYTGVRRTPVCALLGADGAAEFFATTLDVYVSLGQLSEDESDINTADGRPAMKSYARNRLARMLCADSETCSPSDIIQLAEDLRQRQLEVLQRAVAEVSSRLPCPPMTVVLAGSGEFLARMVVDSLPERNLEVVSLSEKLTPQLSAAACAYSVAILAQELPPDAW